MVEGGNHGWVKLKLKYQSAEARAKKTGRERETLGCEGNARGRRKNGDEKIRRKRKRKPGKGERDS